MYTKNIIDKVFFMKKLLLMIFGAAFIVPVLFVQAEEISRFDMQATINEDATVDIVETILYDFGIDKKHGIYRDIPVKYKTTKGSKRTIDLDDIAVTDANGKERTFVVSGEGKNKRIKIGDADKFVTGEQTYVISYIADGVINYFANPARNATHNVAGGHDEFYWNVTGDDWPVRMNAVSAHVNATGISKTDCFVGAYGSTVKCDDILEGVNSVKFMHEGIKVGENMSVVVGITKGAIAQPTTVDKIMKFMRDNLITLVPIGVFLFMWRRWWKYGRDPKGRGTIVPYYKSPDNLSPAEIGMIVDEKVHSRDISASLVNLAVQGCIKIKKVVDKNDYIFIKTGNEKCVLSGEEKTLYDSIFTSICTLCG